VLAAEQFRRGLRLRPQDFWLNFYQGLCDYRLGRFEGAVNAFRVCIALAPETAECYYNRALAYQAVDQLGPALEEHRFLNRDPREPVPGRALDSRPLTRHPDVKGSIDHELAMINDAIRWKRCLITEAPS
jgi:tetratricopeptide (TPR) repeat protein